MQKDRTTMGEAKGTEKGKIPDLPWPENSKTRFHRKQTPN